ncbi:dorsal-related immunity factor Dif-like [Drosophila obscura]|uniref:dorsal-related immunity factor Dif-like n=1 Tax=Drosophila obscura TaxID=7282 RepID=UPI001BB11C80|nr:dorsal-related immunity factor Dif-like [Drosophila obscura]
MLAQVPEETLTQHSRLEARKAVENLKRNLMSSDFSDFHQSAKQPKTSLVQPPQITMTTAPAPQMSPGMGQGLMYATGSPHFMHEIKVENAYMDVDSRSSQCASVDYNFPSPRSTCSTTDGIPPMRIGPNNNLYQNLDAMGATLQEPASYARNGCSPTGFSGGSMTPINHNSNSNMMNNNFLSLKLGAMNPPSITPPQQMDHQSIIKQRFLVQESQPAPHYLQRTQPEQQQQQHLQQQPQHHQQYPPQQQQQQQQQQQPQPEAQNQSFSDLILSSTMMDLGPMDSNDLLQGMEETLSSLGLTGGGGVAGATQMNNHYNNY